MNTLGTEPGTAQLVSERDQWYVPVPWAAGDNLRQALCRQGYRSTLCLDPETHEARLELWPGVSPAEFLAAFDQLRGPGAPPLDRPVPAGKATADKEAEPVPAIQRT